ncbi:hypothetical protein Pint_11544 [Pistacia integerrima]|uniref:Uncharacterized protein n=1 Tax=Pistacia integerrima TaxID=434235 RepID=A0ACC0XFA0_9ROSI|nr:hypothetical protein Pint_11544 [Pistacia integerrima]
MKIMWAYDYALTGKIPKFIGNWNKLTVLRFGGNSLEGPIPSSFSNLTLLKQLQITDLNNVSSSLDFIKNMKNLTYLSLRNALINGSIPSYIGKYKSLQTLFESFSFILDFGLTLILSFNKPFSFFLSFLLLLFYTISMAMYLGNNSLSGGLPQQKGVNLQTIDFSYNYLSGSFPEWVNNDITLNLVGNNFIFNSSNISDFYGLNCLQRYFPCYRNAPRYSHIAINSSGKKFGKYEADDRDIGEASFAVLNSEKWAISNTSRKSMGSLRCYGLGLENGPYNGTRRCKDFDISKEAGGVRKAIRKSFNANVTKNHLEIHLFWAGKGTCCIPEDGSYGPLISALSVTPEFRPTVGIE